MPNSNKITCYKFIFIKLVPFFVILYLMSLGINTYFNSNIYRIQTGNYGLLNNILNGKINTDIVVMGSSRALFNFDSDYITSVTNFTFYNIGVNATQLELQTPLISLYYNHNKPPKVLVVSLDVFSLSQRNDIYEPYQYIPYLNQDILYKQLVNINRSFVLYKYLPLYGYSQFNIELLPEVFKDISKRKHELENRRNGYVERNMEWTKEWDDLKRDNPNGMKFAIEERCINYLETIIDIANKNGSKIIFVYPPEYIESQLFTINRNEIFNKYHEISIKYSIPFWDYSKLPIVNDTHYFYNSQHMNKRGVAQFGKQFSMDLKDLLDAAKE